MNQEVYGYQGNIVQVIPGVDEVDILQDYNYSKDSSLVAFERFISCQKMSKSSVHEYDRNAKILHEKYPFLSGLQHIVESTGVVETARSISEAEIAKVSAYLYFLVIVRILVIQFDDYFYVNSKTINRLAKWYEPYMDAMGITDVCNAVVSVGERTSLRKINEEKTRSRTQNAAIYLILRYHLKSMRDLSYDDWLEFRNVLSKHPYPTNLAPADLMQQALYELGIIPDGHLSRAKWENRKYVWDDMEDLSPVVELYRTYCGTRYARGTIQLKCRVLEQFVRYMEETGKCDLSQLRRSDLLDYIGNVNGSSVSASEKENIVYNLKSFFSFVKSNWYELNQRHIKLCEENVIVLSDFKTKKRCTNLPRPLSDDVFEALKEALSSGFSRLFTYAFLVMCSTGFPAEVIITLTRDCAFKLGNDKYYIRYLRPKSKIEKTTQIAKEVYELIQEVRKMNTQIKPLPHISGKDEYYLFNDGGQRLYQTWLRQVFRELKRTAAKSHPEIADEIMEATAHRIRHTFGTKLREHGADIYAIAYALGHESINTTKIYAKESDKLKEEYIERLNGIYACDADPELKQTLQAMGERRVGEILNDYRNHIGIGVCILQAKENCPFENKCLDCGYVCSTKEDIPDLLYVIESLKSRYEELVLEKNKYKSEEVQREITKTTARIKRLCEKLNYLAEPNASSVVEEVADELNMEEVISFD